MCVCHLVFSVAVQYTKLVTPSVYAFEGNIIRSICKIAIIVLHDGIIVQTYSAGMAPIPELLAVGSFVLGSLS